VGTAGRPRVQGRRLIPPVTAAGIAPLNDKGQTPVIFLLDFESNLINDELTADTDGNHRYR
jgi:hypothetical protein